MYYQCGQTPHNFWANPIGLTIFLGLMKSGWALRNSGLDWVGLTSKKFPKVGLIKKITYLINLNEPILKPISGWVVPSGSKMGSSRVGLVLRVQNLGQILVLLVGFIWPLIFILFQLHEKLTKHQPDQCFINFAECSWGWKMEILDYASVACLLQMLRVVYYSFY